MHRRKLLLWFPVFFREKACQLNQFIISAVTLDKVYGSIRTNTDVEQGNICA
jgi:hypothetical protein